ncbi:hypothetical protein A2963_04420 [Candidatus Roizmanbacteria bacterium RIFCSPLOWO2_01_FULL_40_13]|uniref:HYDIN/VesB/CFA65-like Ig-like domain-containing protein n=1 Tax=Candidatus Gottesmanbacteria bacterium RIFCSPHIGHO2_01_FULL_39_10 TaxID=1798375 RepID=A0A1F5ZR51_9BACT|nr:MAG: hypothetical protein A2773_06975 [Candidatus Gottesmanbacteria bacterium RIFCSPHIGHO2_01_FULL_39_10]OGK47630.1 MAG: hypothetical protein A2963_04420 [Candidatus Roizmanbacteria bacterium RIFCSPLOWO2_01_FULL_40_13]
MKNFMSGEKIILALIGGFTLLAIAVIVVFSASEQKTTNSSTLVASYSAKDTDKPKAKASSLFSDLGKMKVSGEKAGKFTIENTGNKPLQLFGVSSSCGCTVGIITIDGQKSPEFGMHSKGTWTGTVDPGKKADLSVIYRPYIMPVSGTVTRDVFIQTNDPENAKLTFTVKAFVE